MTPERRMRAIGGNVDLNKVEKIIDARYLSLVEREQIKDLHRAGMSIRQIAVELDCSPSTVSREFRRNTVSVHGVHASRLTGSQSDAGPVSASRSW